MLPWKTTNVTKPQPRSVVGQKRKKEPEPVPAAVQAQPSRETKQTGEFTKEEIMKMVDSADQDVRGLRIAMVLIDPGGSSYAREFEANASGVREESIAQSRAPCEIF